MLVKVYAATLQGVHATLITIEVNCSKGVKFFLVGLPDVSIKESHERIISALEFNDLKFPRKQIVVNMAPADIRKEGAAYDLPLAIGILAGSEKIKDDKVSDYLMMGELSLDGTLKSVRGVLPIAIKAKEDGFKGIILPKVNAREAAVVSGLEVYGADNIGDVIRFFNGEADLERTIIDPRKEFYANQAAMEWDFSEVKGQENVKRALEVACAGGHNLLFVGAPGAGKSMLAKRIPSILPPLSLRESLETTQIHSVAGKINHNGSLIAVRPFRSPHHSISSVAMVGGGSYPQPGEISLAHNGVLFLDEIAEFNKNVLEVLRQPLEDRKITISRSKSTVEYPAGFMLIASMNPCPCGHYNNPYKECVCLPQQVQKYLNRLSGPLLDRIDIQIEIIPVPFEAISDTRSAEASAVIRERVMQARKIQEERFAQENGIYCNAQMHTRLLHKHAQPDQAGLMQLKHAMERLSLSARAYDRILRVARTIADLDSSGNVLGHHIAEAISYRNLDRENWAG
ncbi:MAG: Competence protein ComM [Candidatus Ordinivivax streblomastigis]|uniref:Competence protein ComM n=1 Tax=Candidatus Ordinivivax streblomastigis TaxID=2540710 RepID=A0A5M8NUX9_9BACT|nr:MAG: Competence protein ComM [Candidatus Ordinivivax streblomastigis]